MNLADFLHMGGYGGYVWSCYGLTAVALIAIEWGGKRRLARALKSAERRAAIGGVRQ
jgi:heme exporter protein CcmD